MSSNLPPGVTESMIPGNRPEDQERECVIIFTQGEIDDIQRFVKHNPKHELTWILENISDQIEEA